MLVLPGHNNRTRAVAYSPDGRTLASGGADGTVRLWDLVEGAERLSLDGMRSPTLGVAWSLDGSKILASDREATIRAWDARTGELLDSFPRNGGAGADVLGLIEGPGGRQDGCTRSGRVAAAGWRLSQARIYYYHHHRYTAITSDNVIFYGKYMMGWGFPHDLVAERITLRWDDKEEDWLFPTTEAGAKSGAHLAGAGVTTKEKAECAGAFSPDERTLALSRGAFIQLWNIENWQQRMLEGHIKPVSTLAYSPDGRNLASGGHDGLVYLWAMGGPSEPARFDWEIGEIDAVAFSPDGSTVAAGGMTGIVVWDVGEDLWA